MYNFIMNKNLNRMIPIVFAVIGALILIGGSIYSYNREIESENNEKRLEEKADKNQQKADRNQMRADKATALLQAKQDSLLAETQKTNRTTEELKKVYKELASTQQKLIKEQSKSNKLQAETLHQVLGKGHLRIVQSLTYTNTLKIRAVNTTGYPMYDNTVTIENYSEIMKIPFSQNGNIITLNKNEFDKNKVQLPEFNLAGNLEIELLYSTLLQNESINLAFKIQSRSGITYQYSVFFLDKSTGTWQNAYRIYEYNHIYEKLGKMIETSTNANDDFFETRFHFLKTLSL